MICEGSSIPARRIRRGLTSKNAYTISYMHLRAKCLAALAVVSGASRAKGLRARRDSPRRRSRAKDAYTISYMSRDVEDGQDERLTLAHLISSHFGDN